jgi:hypothetical protein
MEVTKIVINGIEITTSDKPIGLETIKLALDRDFQYSCIDTKIEAELRFFCASGKNELDAEYESKGVEGSGYIEITDTCGTNAQIYRFDLDFKKYNNQGDFTTLGLIDVNSLWKKDLEKEVNISDFSGNMSDFYVRNLPLVYNYESDNVYAQIIQDTLDQTHDDGYIPPIPYNTAPPVGPGGPPPTYPYNIYFSHYIMPKVDEKINELEDSDGLLMDYFVITERYSDTTAVFPNFFDTNRISMEVSDIGGGVTTQVSTYSEIEPQPLFENKLDSGTLVIATNNTQLLSNFADITKAECEQIQVNEIIAVGKNYNTPRYVIKNQLSVNTYSFNTTTPFTNTDNYTKSLTIGVDVREFENVWIYYEVVYKIIQIAPATYDIPSGQWQYYPSNKIYFKNIEYKLTNEIDSYFTLSKNVKNVLVDYNDIEPYHTKTKAYLGASFLNSAFGIDYNICNTDCFSDLWITRGDYLRGKINAANFIVKPSDFFRELEKVVCCGLGYFYDTDPNGERKLMSVYDFYSDTLVPSQYQFVHSDLIDGKIEIAPFMPPYYKEVNIGYSASKDSPKDFCKQNNYSIDNDSETTYSKVSDFLASQYLITRGLRLGTQDEEVEFDNNIIILSGTTVSGVPSSYNVTLSQTTGYLADEVQTIPINSASINRRYATAFNLFRHLYKWGFSLFRNKFRLSANKYEGNTIYDYDIKDLRAANTSAYYDGLSGCMLPNEYAKVDKTIDDTTVYFDTDLYVPSVLTFKTANLSSLDLIAMRAYQYKLFSVSDGTNTYYGNLIIANLEDDITEIKLLRRFKDGL